MSSDDAAPHDRANRRLLWIAILFGILVGAGHGIPRYGVFSFGNLHLIGLGVIAIVGIFAAVIALLPAR